MEISSSPRRNFTIIYLTGDLNEIESNVFGEIASELDARYGRGIELKINRPAIAVGTNVSAGSDKR